MLERIVTEPKPAPALLRAGARFGGFKMNRNVVGALLILLIGGLSIGAYKLLSDYYFEKGLVKESASKVALTIRIGGDGFPGYFFTSSPETKRRAARSGIAISFTNDGGAYAERLAKFERGEYDAIVLPVNSYLQHGLAWNYPGVIASVIDESRGADAILCYSDKLRTGKVSDLNDASLKIVYTADSPSSFLLDLPIFDFDLFNLAKVDTWRKEVESSEKVLELARRREGDCFVMWEPEVSRALREIPALKQVFSSADFRGYIVDVLVFRRDFLSRHPDEAALFLESYFQAMRTYASDKPRLIEDMRQATSLKPDEIEPMLKKIDWYGLNENATLQFGLSVTGGVSQTSVEGLVKTISAATNVLIKAGHLKKDPLDGDAYRIINTSTLEAVLTRLPQDGGAVEPEKAAHQFAPIEKGQWQSLKQLGTMHMEPTFIQGTSTLTREGEEQIDRVADLLGNQYADARVVVIGHTSKGSDEDESRKLSLERAESVVQRFVTVHGMPESRFRAEGMGSSKPPVKKPSENQRAYMYRIPRVEFELYLDDTL